MKILLTTLMIVIVGSTAAQRTYPISLADTYIDIATRLKFNRVIDGRKNKIDIGRVQPDGWHAKPKIAMLNQPLEQAMQDVLMRSYMVSVNPGGFIMRVTHLEISEVTPQNTLTKTGLAEIAFEIFQMLDMDSCYYVGSAIGRSEKTGGSVSQKHADNIGHALEDAIQHLTIRQPDNPLYFAIAELESENFSFRNPNTTPVLTEDAHPDGVFLSYDEFLENKPSVTSGYEIENGSTPHLFRVNGDGKKEEVTEGVYAISQNNEFYALFNKQFYLLQRKSGSFHFIGPALVDPAVRKGSWLVFGAAGTVVQSAYSSVKIHYRIDLDSGGFEEMSVVR